MGSVPAVVALVDVVAAAVGISYTAPALAHDPCGMTKAVGNGQRSRRQAFRS